MHAVYGGLPREMCPHALGTKEGRQRVLAFQFGGASRRGLPAAGDWRCFDLEGLEEVSLHDGPWHSRERAQPQHCIDVVELAVGPGF